MSCFITEGYTLDCRNASTGGIKEIWILGGFSGASITNYTQDADGMITAVTGTSGSTFYKFQLPKQSATFTEELGVNDASQAISFAPNITISLPKLDQSLRNVFFELTKQNEIYAIIRDNNNRYFAVGWINGLVVSAGSLQTGQNYTDLNGINALSMTGGEPEPILEIDVTTTLADVFTDITVE